MLPGRPPVLYNFKKGLFGTREIQVLGDVISAAGIRPDPGNLGAVADSSILTDLEGVRGFIGICTCLRKFISGVLNIAESLKTHFGDNVSFQ